MQEVQRKGLEERGVHGEGAHMPWWLPDALWGGVGCWHMQGILPLGSWQPWAELEGGGGVWWCPWEMPGAPQVLAAPGRGLRPEPRRHRKGLAGAVTQNGSKSFKGGMSHPGGG